MEANIEELKIIKTAKFPQVLPTMFKARGEMWSKTSLSVFSVIYATQLPTALPEIKKKQRRKNASKNIQTVKRMRIFCLEILHLTAQNYTVLEDAI